MLSGPPSVFITGAAAGIGRATALRFAAEGYVVGAVDVDEAGLATLVDAAKAAGGRVETARLDVSDPSAWASVLASFVAKTGGRLDVLVNNAGILRMGEFAETDLAMHLKTVRVNVDGVIAGCHTAYPYLQATPGAHVINLCSASAIYGQPELATYSATKFAVRGLTEALELEWQRDDITVLALWPLFVDTGMTHGQSSGTTESLGVRLTADDVAEAVVKAVRPTRFPHVHRAVGRQARVLAVAADVLPSWLVRLSNKRLARLY